MNIQYYIQKSLIELGFSEGEAKIYFEVLRKPGVDAGFLQKKGKYSVAGIYKILNKLVDKGLLYLVKSGRMNVYFAVPLQEISKKLATKGRKIARASEKLQELHRLKNLPEEMEVLEDNDLIDYYLNMPYKMDDFTWCVGSFGAVATFLGVGVEKEFIKKRVGKGIHCDALIYDDTKISREVAGTDNGKRRESKFISGYDYPLEFTYLFGDTYLNFYKDAKGDVKILKAEAPDLARAKLIQYQTIWNSTSK